MTAAHAQAKQCAGGTHRRKIVIPGGSGQVGTLLARFFTALGDEVVVLSRRPSPQRWRVVKWDGLALGPWEREIDGCDVVINMAGRSVNCRYTARHRREILESRVMSTRVLGEAIAQSRRPAPLWLQASTATIYAHSYDQANDEYTGKIGGGEALAPVSWRFSIEVARTWERAFEEARVGRTRKVALRSAMILSPDRGGIFDTLRTLARRGLGGTAGDGRQFISWIHERDFLAAIAWLIERDDVSGVVNVAAPNPLRNAEFMRILRQACGARLALPASNWMLEVGALLMATETELILKSRRVVPRRLIDSGFQFAFPSWPEAAAELCGGKSAAAACDNRPLCTRP